MAVLAEKTSGPAHLPYVVSARVAGLRADLQLQVDANLGCFEGHFPGFPILPGVVQIDWAVACARDFLALLQPVKTLDRLKFTNPIQPGMRLELTIEMDESGDFALFRYHAGETVFSVGRLNYV